MLWAGEELAVVVGSGVVHEVRSGELSGSEGGRKSEIRPKSERNPNGEVRKKTMQVIGSRYERGWRGRAIPISDFFRIWALGFRLSRQLRHWRGRGLFLEPAQQ